MDTLAAMDAGKTGCDHCHGRGFCHNSQMEHDMPKEDTWLHVYWQKKGNAEKLKVVEDDQHLGLFGTICNLRLSG